tara:strand:+ start:1311 stop:1535 length:225 start_codon:yes stop_codon:yes gene_type:complete
MDNKIIKMLMNDKSMNLQQKLLSYMLFSKPEEIPHNPNVYDFIEEGKIIKKMVDEGKITIKGLTSDFELKLKLN